MLETIRIDEFEGCTVLVHNREDGYKQAIVMNGPNAGMVAVCEQPKPDNIFDVKGDVSLYYMAETVYGNMPKRDYFIDSDIGRIVKHTHIPGKFEIKQIRSKYVAYLVSDEQSGTSEFQYIEFVDGE